MNISLDFRCIYFLSKKLQLVPGPHNWPGPLGSGSRPSLSTPLSAKIACATDTVDVV